MEKADVYNLVTKALIKIFNYDYDVGVKNSNLRFQNHVAELMGPYFYILRMLAGPHAKTVWKMLEIKKGLQKASNKVA